MCAKIFVGNLHADANKQELSDLFARYSTVRSIHFSEGLFKGFALIDMEQGANLHKAVDDLHGRLLHGNHLTVSWAIEKPETYHKNDKEKL